MSDQPITPRGSRPKLSDPSTLAERDAADQARHQEALDAAVLAALQRTDDFGEQIAINGGDEAVIRDVLSRPLPPGTAALARPLPPGSTVPAPTNGTHGSEPASNGPPRRPASGKGRRPAIHLYTPVELARIVRTEPDWLIRGYVGPGLMTEIDGKIKAAGKTTLSLDMARAMTTASTFLGYATRRARVLYITEQEQGSFTDALRRAGLIDHGDELGIWFISQLRGRTWPEIIEDAKANLVADEREALFVDTIGKLSGIKEENSAGEWSTAMDPLLEVRDLGKAVIIDRHDRKGGGEVGDSGRGSSQASGDVDIVVQLRRPEGHQPKNRRVLESLGRYAEVTPEKLIIELTEEGYRNLGSDEAVALREATDVCLFHIGAEYETNKQPVPRQRVIELAKAAGVAESTASRALVDLLAAGRIVAHELGGRGKPIGYTLKGAPGFVSNSDLGGERNKQTPEQDRPEESEEELLEQLRMDDGRPDDGARVPARGQAEAADKP